MHRPRLIPVLLLKDKALVKTIGFRNPKYIGDPLHAVHIFNELKADELVFLDIDASKQGRTIDTELVRKIGEEADMPFSVGGGIRSIENIRKLLACGAEKVVINSMAADDPEFIRKASDEFGSSTIVVCMDVKKKWLVGRRIWSYGGTKSSDMNPEKFALLMQNNGAGELIVQSIERDGKMTGYDVDLVRSVSEHVTIPVVALGGAGNLDHMKDVYEHGFANGLASGSFFVYQSTRRGVLINYPDRAAFHVER